MDKITVEITLEQLSVIATAFASLEDDIDCYEKMVDLDRYKPTRSYNPVGGEELKKIIQDTFKQLSQK